MTDRVNMPVEPFGSGLWSSLQEAEKEVRQWAQKHMLRELVFAYEIKGRLPAPPLSDEDWYWAWAFFDGSWSDIDPRGEYRGWKECAWRAYQEGARFAWQWLEQAIQLIEKDTREYARKPYEQTCLDLLPPVDPELNDEYRQALKSICAAVSS